MFFQGKQFANNEVMVNAFSNLFATHEFYKDAIPDKNKYFPFIVAANES